MAVIETWLRQDLKGLVTVRSLQGQVFSLDNGGNLIGVKVTKDGQPVTLTGTVTGYCILSDGQTVTVTGSGKSGIQNVNEAYIVLPQLVYSVPGQISIVIKLTSGSVTTTLAACTGYVYRSRTSNEVVPPGTPIPDLATMEEVIRRATEATDSANTAASSANNAATAAENVNVAMSKSGKVITITTTNRNNTNTTETITEPSLTVTKEGQTITLTATDADGTTEVEYDAVETEEVDEIRDDIRDLTVEVVTNVTNLSGDITDLKSQITQKANIDGYYESMTVGNAEQLVATVGVEDSAPYNFRTAGGSTDIGDRLVDKLVGGTIAWNQLNALNTVNIPSSSTHPNLSITKNADNSVTISGTSGSAQAYPSLSDISMAVITSHVYLLTTGNYANDGGVRFYWNDSSKVIPVGKTYAFYKNIANPNTANVYVRSVVPADTEVNVTAKVMLFDLTQMFGSTIADYIYSLEQATAGAGIAWFRKLFPKPYYEYNAGELMSVKAASHKLVGFNAWDEEWEVGTFNTTTGANLNASNQIRSKNIIKILPNTTYYWNSSVYNWTILYDADGNVIPTPNISGTGSDARSGNSFSIASKHTFTTPANAYGMRFYTGTYTGEYKNNIAINLSWDGERDGEYAPYEEHVYPLDSDLELRGIPKLDASNNLYYDGDTYESDGTVTRKYRIVDLGTLTWTKVDDNKNNKHYFYAGFGANTAKGVTTGKIANGISTRFTADGYSAVCGANCTGYKFNIADSTHLLYVKDESHDSDDAATFKTAVSGVMLVYELATPTTETAGTFQNPQIVEDFGTEEYTDAGVLAEERDIAIPVGHDTMYAANLRAKLEMSPDSPDGDGDYIVRQTNGQNEYVPLVIPTELPANPSADGTYRLKATVSNGVTTLSWEAVT